MRITIARNISFQNLKQLSTETLEPIEQLQINQIIFISTTN